MAAKAAQAHEFITGFTNGYGDYRSDVTLPAASASGGQSRGHC
jgi:ABC-type protease/lipase transport system fused ATPase/permease subunit